MSIKKLTKQQNYMQFAILLSCLYERFFISESHRWLRRKIRVLSTGVEPMTFWLLVQLCSTNELHETGER